MRWIPVLLLPLSVSLSPHAAEVTVERQSVDEFVTWMTPERDDAGEWLTLATRLRDRMRERIAEEPVRATTRWFGFRGETVQARVRIHADRLAELLAAPGPRADQALTIFSDLTAALARNRGKPASVLLPIQTLALGFAAVGTPLVVADVGGATGVLLDLIALAVAGCGLHPVATHHWEGTTPQKIDLAERLIQGFWRRVGERWRELAPETAPAADLDWVETSNHANAALGIGEADFTAACERWLGSS